MSPTRGDKGSFDTLARRYRQGAARPGFAETVAARAEGPRRVSPVLPAALAAAVLAAIALVVSLPVSGPTPAPQADPRWRVSAATPARPEVHLETPARLRVGLSVSTPRRPGVEAGDGVEAPTG